jgi:hypothetical protein
VDARRIPGRSRFSLEKLGMIRVDSLLRWPTLNLDVTRGSLAIPVPSARVTGSAFAASIDGKLQDEREELIEAAIGAGQVPPSLRALVPVRLTATIDGVKSEAEIYVTRDYLSVGTDDDALRIPMWSATAQRLADRFGARLPTGKIVDAIERQATVIPFLKRTAGPQMETTAEMVAHDRAIDDVVAGRTGLIAGHKKDTVISNQRGLPGQGNQVAIYGGRFANGARVQPLKTPHFHRFSDYSQGIRFVAADVRVKTGDGAWEWKRYDEILADRKLSALLSDEGPIRAPLNRYPTDPYAGSLKPQVNR